MGLDSDQTSIARRVLFLAATAAFFILPWRFSAVRLHAPGVAVVCGALFAVSLGNPYERITAKLTAPLLGLAIVGMGFGMNLMEVLRAGAHGMIFTFIGIAIGMGLGLFLGKRLGLPRNPACLISVGTSICGGSAIAAAAPVLKAKGHDIVIASAVVFTLNAAALLVFPAIGRKLGLDEHQFGYWAALGIHDTSSVVGAGMAYGPEALEVGTTVKLARALWIVPVTLLLSVFAAPETEGERRRINIRIPWFIPAFILASALVTWVPAAADAGAFLKELSKYTMIATLFLIGANLSRSKLKTLGWKPVIHGITLWAALGAVWCAAIHAGLVG